MPSSFVRLPRGSSSPLNLERGLIIKVVGPQGKVHLLWCGVSVDPLSLFSQQLGGLKTESGLLIYKCNKVSLKKCVSIPIRKL